MRWGGGGRKKEKKEIISVPYKVNVILVALNM
jgi:hypothetical protein